MSLEGLFEINDHKKLHFIPYLTLLLVTADGSSAWKCSVHVPCFLPLLNSTTKNQSWMMLRMQGQQDSHAAKSSRQASGGGGSEVRHRQSKAEGSRTADKMRRHVVCWHALSSANSSPDIPVYGSQTWTSVWEVGLPTVGGRTQKSGMNVKGNIKFIWRKKTIPAKHILKSCRYSLWVCFCDWWGPIAEICLEKAQWDPAVSGMRTDRGFSCRNCRSWSALQPQRKHTRAQKKSILKSLSANTVLNIRLSNVKVSNHSI